MNPPLQTSLNGAKESINAGYEEAEEDDFCESHERIIHQLPPKIADLIPKISY